MIAMSRAMWLAIASRKLRRRARSIACAAARSGSIVVSVVMEGLFGLACYSLTGKRTRQPGGSNLPKRQVGRF